MEINKRTDRPYKKSYNDEDDECTLTQTFRVLIISWRTLVALFAAKVREAVALAIGGTTGGGGPGGVAVAGHAEPLTTTDFHVEPGQHE